METRDASSQKWRSYGRVFDRIPAFLRRPEYLFRPSQVPIRLFRTARSHGETETVVLRWGPAVRIHPADDIGREVWHSNTYDLTVAEVLARLVDPGETAVDVGANVGILTSILAKRVGNEGRVVCFEPLPSIFKQLEDHLTTWRNELGWATISPMRIAVSDYAGEAILRVPATFSGNSGLASLEAGDPTDEEVLVQVDKLDNIFDSQTSIGVMKIDVEGHEERVLEGAKGLLARGAIRDIVYEDHHAYPGPVSRMLEDYGYKIFRLKKGMVGPCAVDPGTTEPDKYEAPSYLATFDAARSSQRLARLGWLTLGRRLY